MGQQVSPSRVPTHMFLWRALATETRAGRPWDLASRSQDTLAARQARSSGWVNAVYGRMAVLRSHGGFHIRLVR
jgi:hypothetical protein